MTDTETRNRTVREIIEAAGGPMVIAAASEGSVTAEAVYKWPRIGIPDRHWTFILPLARATADEMMAANVAARSETAEASQ